MAGNVPDSVLRDLQAIAASAQDAVAHGAQGDLKQVRARLVECQIAVQAALEESARLLHDEGQARVRQARHATSRLPPALQNP
jgi:hypothetical protein